MTESSFASLKDITPPEMQRTDISWAILQLKALGIDDVLHFDFLSSPPADAMIYALELLFSLQALDSNCKLTLTGAKMAEMPIEPRLAKCLLKSFEFGCSDEMLSIAAMCAVDYPFISIRHKGSQESKDRLAECISEFAVLEGDHLTLLNVYNEAVNNQFDPKWCVSMCLQTKIILRAKEIRKHLERMLISFCPDTPISSCQEDTVTIRKCLVSGFFANACKLGHQGKYVTVRGDVVVSVHQQSVLARYGAPPEWVIYHDVVFTSEPFIREVTRIEPRWLLEMAEHYYTTNLKSLGNEK